MAILDNIKIYCEVDDTTLFDEQLINLANEVIADMIENNIPISQIDKTTETFDLININQQTSVQSLINLYVLRMFDKNLMTASASSQSWLDNRIIYLMHQLKAQFDNIDNSLEDSINGTTVDQIVSKVKDDLMTDSIHMEDV